METIKIYLDNLFAAYPQTPELLNAKAELLNHMEDKYNELKSQGKGENEAVGVVISEFGNIDELMNELNIKPADYTEPQDSVSISREKADEIIVAEKKSAKIVALGVGSILLGLITMLLLGGIVPALRIGRVDFTQPITLSNAYGAITILPLFIGIAIGVTLFISNGNKMEYYESLKKKNVSLSDATRNYLRDRKARYSGFYTTMLTTGVVLCILAPVCLIGTVALWGESDFVSTLATCFLLTLIMVAVFIFISIGGEKEAYDMLLQEDDFSPIHKKSNKLMDVVASIYWPIATCIYLAWSFITFRWELTWIVWPIAGVLFGAVAAFVNGISTMKTMEK